MDRNQIVDELCRLINDTAVDMKSEDKYKRITASSKVMALCQALMVIVNI